MSSTLTLKEILKATGLSAGTFYRWRAAGRLPLPCGELPQRGAAVKLYPASTIEQIKQQRESA